MDYEFVPRPKPFRPSGGVSWPVDAILATATSGDAVRVTHEKKPVGQRNHTPRVRLLKLIRDGLDRRGYDIEWAADGDEAVAVWAIRRETN
jgi:hypothetical protein